MSDSKEVHHLYHSNNEQGALGSLLFGFFVGLGVGVAAGLLNAPKKGTELKKDLKAKMDKTVNKFNKVKKEIAPKFRNALGNVSEEVGQLYEELKEDISKACIDAKENLTKEKFDEIVNKIVKTHKKKKDKYATRLDKIGNEFKESWEELKEHFQKSEK